MSPAAFDDAVALLLAASLVTSDRVKLPNAPFVQPNDGLWMSIDAYSDMLEPIELGANAWEERGRFLVYCFAPFGSGTNDVRMLAKSVANVYRDLGPRNPFYNGASLGVGGRDEDSNFYCIPVGIEVCFQDRSI